MEFDPVFFLYRNKEDTVDGIRSALGLAVENMSVFGAVLDVELDPFDDNSVEMVELIREMGGDILTTVETNSELFDLTPITLEEIGDRLRRMKYIIPYGTK